ncbi:MAG: glycosyltransferase family 4 protein [Chloroflexi bacterium]|nr:glycosyltransferase family 4 protein [Chloroflexota bacterium]
MKVLHVIQRYYPYIGGAEQVFEQIGKRLARDGESVTVYTTDAWDLERFWRADKRAVELQNETRDRVYIQRFPIEYLPFSALAFPALKRSMSILAALPFHTLPLLFSLARFVPYVPALDDALATTSEHFDLVHTANISLDSSVVAAYRFARRKKIPFVITPFLHLGESDDPKVVRFYTLPHQLAILERADAVIVMTEREGNALLERGIPREKIHRIGAGVEPNDILGGDGMRFRQAHNLHAPIVTYIGTAAYDKGTMHLIQAMQKVWQTRDAVLILAGSHLSDFENYFVRLPDEIKKRVRRLGFINAQEKRDLLAATDILAMPSRTDSFGIVYLEAWLYNKPVIGAWAGGVPDVIDDGQNGFLVKFGDVDAIAARLLELVGNRALAERMGKNGNTKVLHEMTWEEQYAKVRALYASLVRHAWNVMRET